MMNVFFHSKGAFKFDFVILVAGFKSFSAQHEMFYTEPITCPSLHVYGDTDRVIPKGLLFFCVL